MDTYLAVCALLTRRSRPLLARCSPGDQARARNSRASPSAATAASQQTGGDGRRNKKATRIATPAATARARRATHARHRRHRRRRHRRRSPPLHDDLRYAAMCDDVAAAAATACGGGGERAETRIVTTKKARVSRRSALRARGYKTRHHTIAIVDPFIKAELYNMLQTTTSICIR